MGGGKPRSLELEEDLGETSSGITDANGNRVLRVVKRDATEMAEVETTERIIQVLAPNDIQEVNLPLGAEEQAASQEHSGEEVVINFDGSVDAVNFPYAWTRQL